VDPTGRRSGANNDHAAAVRRALRLVETLLARRLDADRTWEVLVPILMELDPTVLGSKLRKAIASAFVGLADRDARTPDRIEDLFAADGVSEGVQWASADAMRAIDRRHGTSRAVALKNHPRCPPAIVTHLLAGQPAE
jgi:hypothetical protein